MTQCDHVIRIVTWATFGANVVLLTYNLWLLRFLRRLWNRLKARERPAARWTRAETHKDRW